MHNTSNFELTPRKREVLRLVCDGYKNTAIASLLNLTPKTVENHIQDLAEQLEPELDVNLSRRMRLLLWAIANGEVASDSALGRVLGEFHVCR